MVEQTYRVDMIPNGVPLVVHVSQYDTEARTLIFELYKGDVAYEVPAGAVASIAGTKPDKTAFIYPMAIDGNVVSIDLKQQMAIVAGDVLAEIQITDSAGKIGSANFVIRVERGPIDENSVISETDIPIFEQLVSDAQTAANEAQTAAEDAADAAESVGSIVPASTGTAGQVLTKKATGADWENLQWGGITGALTDQTDLASALDAKADKTMLAPVESTSTASQNYAVGDYLVYNGILYSVTAAISVGESLTPGTNISATSAGAELTTLKNGLAIRRRAAQLSINGSTSIPLFNTYTFGIIYGEYANQYYSMPFDVMSIESKHQMFISNSAYIDFQGSLANGTITTSNNTGFTRIVVVLYKVSL